MKDRREELWNILIRPRDHEHNVKSVRENKHDLIVVWQLGTGEKQDYVPCLHCKGYFTATYMVQHEKNVSTKRQKVEMKNTRWKQVELP